MAKQIFTTANIAHYRRFHYTQKMDAFVRLQRQLKSKPALTALVSEKARAWVVLPTPIIQTTSTDTLASQALAAEQSIFALCALLQPQTHVVLILPEQLDPAVLEYHLSLLFADSAARRSARKRLHLIITGAVSGSITQRLLGSKRLRDGIIKAIPKKVSAVLLCTQVTADEQRLAFALQLPLFGLDPTLGYLGTKSGSRALFRTADVALPFGREHIRSVKQLTNALQAIHKHDRTVKYALLKLDHSFGGSGHAFIPLNKLPRSLAAIEPYIRSHLRTTNVTLTPEQFLQRLCDEGGVAEEWLETKGMQSPSVQLLILPDRTVEVLSVHEQRFDRQQYNHYTGADFPARTSLRPLVLKQVKKIGNILARQGAIGNFSIDFIALRNKKRWSLYVVELNTRITSTILPRNFVQAVTHAETQPDGTMKRNTRAIYYVIAEQFPLPPDLFTEPAQCLQFINEAGLQFDHRSHTGIIVHRTQYLSEQNSIGLIAVGKSNQSADEQLVILRRALERYSSRAAASAVAATPVGTVNVQRLVRTFIKYAKIPSPSHQEGALRAVLREDLMALGVKTRIDRAGNLLGTLPGTGTPLMLCAHMDTVRPCDRIKPVIRGDVIRTDGTSVLGADDKAGIAAIMETLQLLRAGNIKHPPLELIFSTGEETFSDGAAELDFSQLHAPIGYVVDGGEVSEIDYRSAYLADVHITIRGKAAHSGIEPEKGISAIQIAAEAISALKLGRIDAETTANIGTITGGSIRNAIPAEAYVHGEARSFSKRKIEDELERMHKAFQDAAERHGGLLEINSKVALDGYTLSKNSPAIQHVMKAMQQIGIKPKLVASIGATDANTFIRHGIQAVNIGAGGQLPHTVDEYLPISELTKAAQLILAIVRTAI